MIKFKVSCLFGHPILGCIYFDCPKLFLNLVTEDFHFGPPDLKSLRTAD